MTDNGCAIAIAEALAAFHEGCDGEGLRHSNFCWESTYPDECEVASAVDAAGLPRCGVCRKPEVLHTPAFAERSHPFETAA